MVDVPVHDQDLGPLCVIDKLLRGEGYVVEEAEARRGALVRVVPWRANDREPVSDLALSHVSRQLGRGPRGVEGALLRRGRHVVVGHPMRSDLLGEIPLKQSVQRCCSFFFVTTHFN